MAADSHERMNPITAVRAVTAGVDLKLNGVYPRAIRVGTSGTLTIQGVDDAEAVQIVVNAGFWDPTAVKMVTAVGTAADVRVGY
jgi:hypothetical protein